MGVAATVGFQFSHHRLCSNTVHLQGLSGTGGTLTEIFSFQIRDLTYLLIQNQTSAISASMDPTHESFICCLPFELISAITSYLSQPETLILLRTCRHLKHMMEPLLYKHIKVSWHQQGAHRSLMQNLISRPELARMVINFEGYLYPVFGLSGTENKAGVLGRWKASLLVFARGPKAAPVDSEAGRAHYEALLAQALDNMVNLRSLAVAPFSQGAWTHKILTQVVAPRVRLTSLSISRPAGRTSMPLPLTQQTKLQFTALAISQPTLEMLSIPNNFDVPQGSFTAKDLPQLAFVECGWLAAQTLLSGRPVTSLELLEFPVEGELENGWERIASSTRPLLKLSLTVGRRRIDLLSINFRGIAVHLPHLQELTLRDLFDIHYDAVSDLVIFCLLSHHLISSYRDYNTRYWKAFRSLPSSENSASHSCFPSPSRKTVIDGIRL